MVNNDYLLRFWSHINSRLCIEIRTAELAIRMKDGHSPNIDLPQCVVRVAA